MRKRRRLYSNQNSPDAVSIMGKINFSGLFNRKNNNKANDNKIVPKISCAFLSFLLSSGNIISKKFSAFFLNQCSNSWAHSLCTAKSPSPAKKSGIPPGPGNQPSRGLAIMRVIPATSYAIFLSLFFIKLLYFSSIKLCLIVRLCKPTFTGKYLLDNSNKLKD